MDVLVEKYGGSSLATTERIYKIAERAIERARPGYPLVMVVSAMGDETDRLKALAQKMCRGTPSAREMDQLVSTGEVVSSALVAMAIRDQGRDAVSLSGNQIKLETDNRHGYARIKWIRGADRIKEALEEGKIVVIAGYQGIAEGTDHVTTLGRGGSNLTTIALSHVLGAKRCRMYTDVDGIYTANPRIVPKAKRFDRISYLQMWQLARAGSEVLMERSVLLAYNLGIEIHVLLSPSLGESSRGSLVCSGSTPEDIEGTALMQPALAIRNKSLVKVSRLPNKPGSADKLEAAFAGFNIEPANQGGSGKNAVISYLCEPEDLPVILKRLKTLDFGKIEAGREIAAFTLVHPLSEEAQSRSRALKALKGAGVNIEMFSADGTLMLAVKRTSLKRAAKALAKEFDLLS